MCERPKIHVFLGAPPPSSCPTSVPEGRAEDGGRPPVAWRHLELRWGGGRRLEPAETTEGQTDETSPSSVKEPDSGQEDESSVLVQEYLDSCFPAAQPEPEPEPHAPALSTHSHYLTTWTLSQALVLRGRTGVQSASSPDKTPSKSNQSLASFSSSSGTPELFSPATPSPPASSFELFTHPRLTQRVEEGGVVLEATADGIFCSQESGTTHTDSSTKSPCSKKARISEESTRESTADRTPTKSTNTSSKKAQISKEPITETPDRTPTKITTTSSKKGRISGEYTRESSSDRTPTKITTTSSKKGRISGESSSDRTPTKSISTISKKARISGEYTGESSSDRTPTKTTTITSKRVLLCEESTTEIPDRTLTKITTTSSKKGLISGESSSDRTPTKTTSSSSRRALFSEESTTETLDRNPTKTTSMRLQSATTRLVQCDKRGLRYSVLVAVVHPCHLKEVKVKSGRSAGTFVPLASIVVTDQSAVEMIVVLWRRAAFWVLTVTPGDILMMTGFQVGENRWRGETHLQSTFSSKLLNLGHVTASPAAPHHVDACSLASLIGYLRERRPLLASLPRQPPQDLNRLPYATLRSLRVNTLVHALLRVTNIHPSSEWWREAESGSRLAVQQKVILIVEQPNGQQGAVLMWGAAVDWASRFSHDKAAVWDFRFLLVREGLTSDSPELHSTPWSSVRVVDPTDRRAQDFHRWRHDHKGTSSTLELDLDTLLSQKYSGDVELRVQVFTFQFQDGPLSQSGPQPVLDGSTPPEDILMVLSGDITYTGCGRCSAELDTDANGIYSPCYPCLPHTAVRRYYRPGMLTVSGQGQRQVCVQVLPVPLQNILNVPPDRLHRTSGLERKNIYVAAERISCLLSLPRKTFVVTMRSHFLCDENSIPLSQDFTLLDLQFPPG
ncbi:shieldin complex subunit 2 isoform 2-T4 [Pholidichthys leucotaenia]